MKELLTRTLSGAIYIGILIGSLLLGPLTFGIVCLIILYIATRELIAISGPMTRGWHTELAGLGAMLLFAGLALLWFRVERISAPAFLIAGAITLSLILLMTPRLYIRKTASQIYLILTYLLLPLLMLLALMDPIRNGLRSPDIVLGLFVMIWTFDSFAYLVGKSVGKHKLAPSISPKKSWEGFAGGLVASLIAAYIWQSTHPEIGLSVWIILSLATSVAGTLGDLFESQLKRRASVKDSGTLIPGHGGILDRIDSVLFAAPLSLLIILLFS